jgi:hypothetical protein
MFRAVLATLLLTISGAWAVLLLGMENCTMAAADSLSLGVVVICLNGVGFALLSSIRIAPISVLGLALPSLMASVYYSFFAMRFAFGWWHSGVSSCQALTGLPFEMDGRELLHVVIWIFASLSFWIGLAYVTIPTRRSKALQS